MQDIGQYKSKSTVNVLDITVCHMLYAVALVGKSICLVCLCVHSMIVVCVCLCSLVFRHIIVNNHELQYLLHTSRY